MTKEELIKELVPYDNKSEVFFIDDIRKAVDEEEGIELETTVEVNHKGKKTIVLIGY